MEKDTYDRTPSLDPQAKAQRNGMILDLRLNGCSYQSIAESFNLSNVRVRKIALREAERCGVLSQVNKMGYKAKG